MLTQLPDSGGAWVDLGRVDMVLAGPHAGAHAVTIGMASGAVLELSCGSDREAQELRDRLAAFLNEKRSLPG